MTTLPSIDLLLLRTKALAALDLMMSPEWQYRYYSFNSAWGPDEQMAGMRNGSGDEWFLVFHGKGWAALKGLKQSSPAWDVGGPEMAADIQKSFPEELCDFASEAAFRWNETSFGYYRPSAGAAWVSARAATRFADLQGGEPELLDILTATAQKYVDFAADYYEREIPLSAVQRVFALEPMTEVLFSGLCQESSLSDLSRELFDEIGYPPGPGVAETGG